MSRLTRDGTAEPVSRDQIHRHARGQGNIHFPCSADHVQDWQPYPVDPYSAICHDHTYASPRPKPVSCNQPPVGPLTPVAPPVLQITTPDNDASAAAEPLLHALLSYSHCNWKQAALSRRQPFTNLLVYTNSPQVPTPRVVTAASNVSSTPW